MSGSISVKRNVRGEMTGFVLGEFRERVNFARRNVWGESSERDMSGESPEREEVVWEKFFEGVIFHEGNVRRECPGVEIVLDGCPVSQAGLQISMCNGYDLATLVNTRKHTHTDRQRDRQTDRKKHTSDKPS